MNIPKYVEMYRKDLKLKNYSDNTIKNYVVQVDIFLRNQERCFTEPSKINESSIKNWLLQFKTRNSMCHSISALKLFYKLTIKQPLKFRHIEYPKSEKKLPQIIESEFLKDRIFKIENLKHRSIIMSCYFMNNYVFLLYENLWNLYNKITIRESIYRTIYRY